MSQADLEHEMLDGRVEPDEQVLREKFREWIEPILVVLVALLLGAVAFLIPVTLDLRSDVEQEGIERARGTANLCRLLDGLGFTVEDDNRCFDSEVYQHWDQHQGEQTRAAGTAQVTLDLLCDFAISEGNLVPEQCAYRVEQRQNSQEEP